MDFQNRPTDPAELLRQAVQSHQKGDLAGAARGYSRYLELRPGDPQALTNLAWVKAQTGDSETAVATLRKVLQIAPGFAAAWNILGVVHQQRMEMDEAVACFRACIQRSPASADAHFNLAKLLLNLRRLEEAFAAFSAAGKLVPGHPEPLHGQCRARFLQGRLKEAVALAQEARRRFPDSPRARIEPVLFMNYERFDTEAEIARAHAELGQWLVGQAGGQPEARFGAAGARIRIGYVASNLHLHSNYRCIGPVIAAHDRTLVEVFVYHGGEMVDQATRYLMQAVEHWRDCRGQPAEAVAAAMRRDGIDIAVGCEGLFHELTPLVLARKPAPVQALWSGYPHALGLPTVDYRITDAVLDPPAADEQGACERPWRLPWFRTFLPPADAPEPGSLPAASTGRLTLVSFNNLAKLGDSCLGLWAKVLAGLPGSRLRISQADEGSGREALLQRLVANGIALDRVECLPYLGYREYLEAHREADLHLDSFPYPGVTVAATALWMGLPSMCVAGAGAAGREGAAQLAAAGFPELIARDEGEYIGKYLAFGRDLEALSAFRKAARGRMASSHLLDPAGLARNLEGAYAGMLRERRAGR